MNQYISYRNLHINDAPYLCQLGNGQGVSNNMNEILPHVFTEQEAVNFIIQTSQNLIKNYVYAILYKNVLVGVVHFYPQESLYGTSVTIGYWISEEYWNKGIMSWIAKERSHHIFKETKYSRIFAILTDETDESYQTLEKAGFRKENDPPKSITKNQNFVNTLILSMNKPKPVKE